MDWVFLSDVGPGEFTPGLALRDIWEEKLTKEREFHSII